MAGYKNFRLIIGIVTALVLTFNAVFLPAAALEAGSVNETGSVEYIGDDRSALEPAESEFAEKEENTQNDSVGAEEDTQDDKKENIPQEGESGQEADAPSENAGDAVSTNQEEVREDIPPDPDTPVKLWEDWREAAKLPAPTGDRAEDMASAARALLGYSLRGEDSGAFCWNRLLAEFCLDYAEVSKEALPRPEEGQDWAELLESGDLFRRDEEAIAAGTLVFLALDGQDGEGRLSVGIVTEIEEGVLTVVMADENGMVVSQSVARNDASFLGYCSVSERSQMCEAAKMVDGWALVSSEEGLRSALSSTEENINIKLRESFPVVNAPLVIPEGKNVTMDLNGKTLTNNSSENPEGSLFKILTEATLTIEDGTQDIEDNSADPEITTSTGNKYGNTASYENGTLTYYVTESQVTDSKTGKTTETVYRHEVPVPLVPQSVGTLDGNGKEESIFWMSGDAAKLIIQGGKICNSSKIAIYCDSSDSTVQIEGGYICNNSVKDIGGGAAISAKKPTTIHINGGYIYNNTSQGNGGAIYSEGADVTVSGGYIFSNSASTNSEGGGGAIYAQGGSVALNGGYLFDNSAKGGYGGAVYMKDGTLTVSDPAVLAGNRSVKEGGMEGTGTLDAGGGAVALFGSTDVTISGGYITGNESEKTGGGGIFCTEGAYLYIDKILATNNHARGFGGGLAGCPTGHVFVLGGAAAVFDNRADGTQLAGAGSTKHADKDALADTTFMESGYSDFFCALGGQVQTSMLGGGMENWKGSCDGRYVNAEGMSDGWLTAYFRMGLTANPSDVDKSAAYEAAAAAGKALYINGNESYTHAAQSCATALCSLVTGRLRKI